MRRWMASTGDTEGDQRRRGRRPGDERTLTCVDSPACDAPQTTRPSPHDQTHHDNCQTHTSRRHFPPSLLRSLVPMMIPSLRSSGTRNRGQDG